MSLARGPDLSQSTSDSSPLFLLSPTALRPMTSHARIEGGASYTKGAHDVADPRLVPRKNFLPQLPSKTEANSSGDEAEEDTDSDAYRQKMWAGQANILVAVRLRPLLSHDRDREEIVKVVGEKEVAVLTRSPGGLVEPMLSANSPVRRYTMHPLRKPRHASASPSISSGARSREKRYAFDSVFTPHDGQQKVYQHTTKFLIHGVLNGFNATVFAYGCTGAGKTYTMFGTPEEPGIMARTLEDLFRNIERVHADPTGRVQYRVAVSFLEVYNENIRDLLSASSSCSSASSMPTSEFLDLREDPVRGSVVAGLSEVEASNAKDVMKLLRRGNKYRSQESTAANSVSSRSHAVLQVHIAQKEKSTLSGSTADPEETDTGSSGDNKRPDSMETTVNQSSLVASLQEEIATLKTALLRQQEQGEAERRSPVESELRWVENKKPSFSSKSSDNNSEEEDWKSTKLREARQYITESFEERRRLHHALLTLEHQIRVRLRELQTSEQSPAPLNGAQSPAKSTSVATEQKPQECSSSLTTMVTSTLTTSASPTSDGAMEDQLLVFLSRERDGLIQQLARNEGAMDEFRRGIEQSPLMERNALIRDVLLMEYRIGNLEIDKMQLQTLRGLQMGVGPRLPIMRRLAASRALPTATRRLAPRAAAPFVSNSLVAARAPLQSRTFATDGGDFFLEDDEDDSFVQYPPVAARVQCQAPQFTAQAVVDGDITDVSLDTYRGQYVVLFFYPKDFTYVCPTEIIAFNDRAEEFKALNTQLIAVSCDSPESHLAWTRLPRNKGGLGKMDIPIVSDITKVISAKYGVLVEQAGVALRGLFIMDKEGVLQQITVNNMPIGRSVDETLRLIKALQFVEEHGEVCPANWQPGDKTIKATPTDSYEYFSTVKEDAEDDDAVALTLVKSKAQFDALVKSGKPVVADFMAPWCGKCAQILPFVEDLAEAHPEVTFAKLDVSIPEVEQLKDDLEVGAYPEFRFFKGGKEVHEKISGYKKSLLKNAVQKLL
ncbi:Peroxiredoxin prdx-2 [Phytophthora ramorum]|uniref:Peroxiredoxin prdx-2 n=2 Tax=Phytophthora ramorum TaxID=164328 RepID=UPI0030A43566|nr:Peroxiredoxin prdx-2 [Phytophthora ramorum]